MDGNRPAVVLYERAVASLPARPLFQRALADSTMELPVINAARRFNYLVL